MVKNLLIILLVIIVVVISAGCLTDSSNDKNQTVPEPGNIKGHDLIVGEWVTNGYVSDSGVYYSKVIDDYKIDNTMNRTFLLSDGINTVSWKAVWVYNSDGTYDIYYDPFTLQINNNGKYANVNSPDFGVDKLPFSRVTEGSNISGIWINSKEYEFPNGFDYMEINAEDNGTALIRFYDAEETKSIKVAAEWVMLGKNSYVFTISHTIHAAIENDGKLHDNSSYVYTKTE
ncbi:MAG: hypothetical protein Q4Q53_00475 [Methanocorpusculum sp.]|nr:hypothetical protein [Methanocorpusculum sp.]